MGGGLMQLVAMGAQDVYLTGNPQITFFKVVYRRHTNFSKEAIEQTFNGSISSGVGTLNCTLSRNGDLVQEIYVVGTVENATAGDDVTDLIDHVEVEIGGQKIDKHYAQWLDIYNELFETDSSHARRDVMGAGRAGTVYLPLRFWFNRNPGLALPLIALQYHEVKINMTLNPVRTPTGANLSSVKISEAKLLVNYLYLDTDERRRFAQVSHEYLIEQVQHTGVENKAKITMNFNHPVKALFWTSTTKPTGNAKLQLNGHDRFSEQAHDYFHLVQPYECGLGHSKVLNSTDRTWAAGPASTAAATGDKDNVSMYSFCLKPAEHQPSGTCNFSRIDNAVLNLGTATYTTKGVYLFALNYNVLRIMSGMGGLAYSN
jgi:hypothetical protein